MEATDTVNYINLWTHEFLMKHFDVPLNDNAQVLLIIAGIWAVYFLGKIKYSSRNTLEKFFPVSWRDSPIVSFFDLILVTCIGFILVVVILEPYNQATSLTGGITWTTILQFLLGNNQNTAKSIPDKLSN
ncbi:hypothetical protein [Lewinella sp. IMCC34183]|uniref:hypothetical protein n=1 Tax=Lewinella sp. IMCC34183 TaxID=2248762 RepID=UPI0013006862|nr:hypothetical protein [Lewinella sp. IMCC34183]